MRGQEVPLEMEDMTFGVSSFRSYLPSNEIRLPLLSRFCIYMSLGATLRLLDIYPQSCVCSVLPVLDQPCISVCV